MVTKVPRISVDGMNNSTQSWRFLFHVKGVKYYNFMQEVSKKFNCLYSNLLDLTSNITARTFYMFYV
jgi:hypothetical protein